MSVNRPNQWISVLILLCTLFFTGCEAPETAVPAPTEPPAPQRPTATPPPPAATPMPTDVPVAEAVPHALRLQGFAVQLECSKTAPCETAGGEDPDGAVLLVYTNGGELRESHPLPGSGQVFHAWDSEGELGYFFLDFTTSGIQEVRRGTVLREYTLRGGHFYLGVPGAPRFAVTILPGNTDSGLSEILMVPGMGYVAVAGVPHELVLPVQVYQGDEFNLDIWYTEEPYGIGGDIVFPVWYGLHWLDVEDPVEVLPGDLNFSAVSADGRLVAYTPFPSGPLTVRDWQNASDTVFDLLPGQERGAGYAVFSPDSLRIAWVEAHGSFANGDFTSTLRVASLSDGDTRDWGLEQIAALTGEDVVSFYPKAWLDGHTLLVQVNPTAKGDHAQVLILDVAGAARPRLLPGSLVGLVWSE